MTDGRIDVDTAAFCLFSLEKLFFVEDKEKFEIVFEENFARIAFLLAEKLPR